MTIELQDDPIWSPKTPISKMYNPLAVITIMDPQITPLNTYIPNDPKIPATSGWTGDQIAEAYKIPKGHPTWPITINMNDLPRNLSYLGGWVAWIQHVDSVRKGSEPAGTPEGNSFRANINGKSGELVLGVGTNRTVDFATNTYNEYGDVDGDEVKTRSEEWMGLLLNEGANETRKYWLLTGNFPVFTIHGWTFGWIVFKHGTKIRAGARGEKWELKKKQLFNWMPASDPFHYIRQQMQQQQLPLNKL